MKNEVDGRREIASRNTAWANVIARKLTRWGVTPNQISMMSVFFALIGCVLLVCTVIYPDFNKYVAYILFIVCMQSRLLCNLFDGMVAIEGGKKSANGDLYNGKKSANGDLYNDMPDRFADALFIIPVGYVAGGFGIELGWLAALLAIMTAYFRWIGAYKTHEHYFNGPMAKQHRMALLTVTFVIAAGTLHWGYEQIVCLIALILMNIGLIVTLIRRLYFIAHTSNNELK